MSNYSTSPENGRKPEQAYIGIDLEHVTAEQRARLDDAVAQVFKNIPYETHEWKNHNEPFAIRLNERELRRERHNRIEYQGPYGLSGSSLTLDEQGAAKKVRKNIFHPFEQSPWQQSRFILTYATWWSEQITAGGDEVKFHYIPEEQRVTGGGARHLMDRLGFGPDADSCDVLSEIIELLAAKAHGENPEASW